MQPVRVDWNRVPVSLHHESLDVLNNLLLHLRDVYNLTKRSIPMPDRINGGYIAFLYQACDPQWLLSWNEEFVGENNG